MVCLGGQRGAASTTGDVTADAGGANCSSACLKALGEASLGHAASAYMGGACTMSAARPRGGALVAANASHARTHGETLITPRFCCNATARHKCGPMHLVRQCKTSARWMCGGLPCQPPCLAKGWGIAFFAQPSAGQPVRRQTPPGGTGLGPGQNANQRKLIRIRRSRYFAAGPFDRKG